MMNTQQSIDHLADAIEALADDHRARVARVEVRRSKAAQIEGVLAQRFAIVRRALDEYERAVAEQFETLLALEDEEELATIGERPKQEKPKPIPPPEKFQAILGGAGKANGAA